MLLIICELMTYYAFFFFLILKNDDECRRGTGVINNNFNERNKHKIILKTFSKDNYKTILELLPIGRITLEVSYKYPLLQTKLYILIKNFTD